LRRLRAADRAVILNLIASILSLPCGFADLTLVIKRTEIAGGSFELEGTKP
jgi:hypothetical protein